MIKRQWLHDASKFGAGLVLADFIALWWFSIQDRVPDFFLGLPLGDSIVTAMIVDIFLFIMLVHYGWNIGTIPGLKERVYLTVAGVIFTTIAIAHLLRILFDGDVTIIGWDVPIFLSWLGVVAAIYLSYSSFHLAARLKR